MTTCQACVIGACDDHQRPPVCVCDRPRFDGRCNCTRDHAIGECRNCHHPYRPDVPGFTACRDAWRTQLTQVHFPEDDRSQACG